MTGGGRAWVRARLYMPTLAATRYNPVIKTFYQHLLAEGKCKKTAMIAAMRKMMIILNTMIKNNQQWTPKLT
jgi:transposase